MSNARVSGTVRWFNEAKGYGFLESRNHPDKDIFVHFTSIRCDGFKTLSEGETVEFEIDSNGDKGIQAKNVIRIGQPGNLMTEQTGARY